ncbi:MAG: TolC family protein [Pyrinomonadaceae bacterium]
MQQYTQDPTITSLEARPVPPAPSMTRLGVSSANSLPLTLNEAIRLALENNNDIEVARNDVRFAETQLISLQGFYDPVFVLTPQVTRSSRPVTSVLSGGNDAGTLTQTDFELNPGLNKNFEIGGGQYQFFYNNLRQNTTSAFSNLNPIFSSSLGVSFTQPLLRDRSIDRQRREIRVQRVRVEQSDADFRRLTTETIARVQAAYWDLVFALREQENRLSGLDLVRQQFRLTEARVAAGAAAPLERAEVQTELAGRESDLLSATQQVTVAENTLKQLILRDPLVKEWSAIVTPTDAPTFDTTPVNLDEALKEARTNRQELRRLQLQNNINDIDIKYYRNQTKPRIDLVSTVSTTGLAGTPVAASGSLTGGTVITAPNTGPTTTPSGQIPIINGDPTTQANAFLLQQINQLRTLQGLTSVTVPSVTPDPGSSIPTNLIGSYGRTTRNLFGFDTGNISVGVTIQIPLRNRTAEANLAGARVQRTQLEANTRAQEQLVEVEVRNAAQSVETFAANSAFSSLAKAKRRTATGRRAAAFEVGRRPRFWSFNARTN